MYNRLYSFVVENNVLYNKQFCFQKEHSTEHAILQLTSQILQSFEEDKFIIGVFIDLSKAFKGLLFIKCSLKKASPVTKIDFCE